MSDTTSLATIDARPPVAVTPTELSYQAGLHLLASIDDSEFEKRIEAAQRGQQRLQRLVREMLTPEVDYGIIPGTDKPSIFQPGAERMAVFFRLVPEFRPEVRYGDGRTAPEVIVTTICLMHLGEIAGPVVGSGVGVCTSWEKRWRYRKGERNCPKCGAEGTIHRSSEKHGGGWYCNGKKGGCWQKFPQDAQEIMGQQIGDVENPDPLDMLHTYHRMSEKRSFVNATVRTTGLREIFNTFEPPDEDGGEPEPSRQRPPASARRGGSPSAPTQPSNPPACQISGCGLVLKQPEVAWSKHFVPGHFFCKQHQEEGKAMLLDSQAAPANGHSREAQQPEAVVANETGDEFEDPFSDEPQGTLLDTRGRPVPSGNAYQQGA